MDSNNLDNINSNETLSQDSGLRKQLKGLSAGKSMVLKQTISRINTVLLSCIQLKQKILLLEAESSDSDMIASNKLIKLRIKLLKKLSFTRNQLYGLANTKNETQEVLSQYQSVLFEYAPDLHHALFLRSDDRLLVGSLLGNGTITQEDIDSSRIKSYLHYEEPHLRVLSQELQTRIIDTLQNHPQSGELHTNIQKRRYPVLFFLVLSIGTGIYKSDILSLFSSIFNNQEKITLPDSDTYVSFEMISSSDDDEPTRSAELELYEIEKKHAQNKFIIEHSNNTVQAPELPPTLETIIKFPFPERSNVMQKSVQSLLQRQIARISGNSTTEILLRHTINQIFESQKKSQLRDDIFLFNFGDGGVLGLHVEHDESNRDIILDTHIQFQEMIRQVLTHEVYHGIFEHSDIKAADEGRTELETIKTVWQAKALDMFSPTHPYTPFVVHTYLIQKAYPDTYTLYEFMPNLRITSELIQKSKDSELSAMIGDMYSQAPLLIFPTNIQILSCGGYDTVYDLVTQDTDIPPNMKTFLLQELDMYKKSELYDLDKTDEQQKVQFLTEWFANNKHKSVYQEPKLPKFSSEGEGESEKDKTLTAGEKAVRGVLGVILGILSLFAIHHYIFGHSTKKVKKHTLEYLDEIIEQLPPESNDLKEVVEDLKLFISTENSKLNAFDTHSTRMYGEGKITYLNAMYVSFLTYAAILYMAITSGSIQQFSGVSFIFLTFLAILDKKINKPKYTLSLILRNHFKQSLTHLLSTYTGGDIGAYYREYIDKNLPQDNDLKYSTAEVGENEYQLSDKEIHTLDRILAIGKFTESTISISFSNIAAVKKAIRSVQRAAEDKTPPPELQDKKAAIYFFDIYPLKHSHTIGANPLKIIKNDMACLKYALQKMRIHTLNTKNLDCILHLVIRKQSIKKFTVTPSTNIDQLYQEILEMYLFYIQGEAYRSVFKYAPSSVVDHAIKDAQGEYTAYYLSEIFIAHSENITNSEA